MEQAARVSRLAHVRMVGLLSLLLLADAGFILNAVDSIMVDGPTVMIMFASEVRRLARAAAARLTPKLIPPSPIAQYLILVATALATVAKYVINCVDMRREAPWEEKSIWVFYVELTAGALHSSLPSSPPHVAEPTLLHERSQTSSSS